MIRIMIIKNNYCRQIVYMKNVNANVFVREFKPVCILSITFYRCLSDWCLSQTVAVLVNTNNKLTGRFRGLGLRGDTGLKTNS